MQIIKEIIKNYQLLNLKDISSSELVELAKENDHRTLSGKKLLSIDKFIKKYRNTNGCK